jgi:hypothetical protein
LESDWQLQLPHQDLLQAFAVPGHYYLAMPVVQAPGKQQRKNFLFSFCCEFFTPQQTDNEGILETDSPIRTIISKLQSPKAMNY